MPGKSGPQYAIPLRFHYPNGWCDGEISLGRVGPSIQERFARGASPPNYLAAEA